MEYATLLDTLLVMLTVRFCVPVVRTGSFRSDTLCLPAETPRLHKHRRSEKAIGYTDCETRHNMPHHMRALNASGTLS